MSGGDERRPWGEFFVLRSGEGFKAKSLVVLPGKRLSMQYHDHREEHWVVVRGTAEVLVAELGSERSTQPQLLHRGQIAFIPRRAVHRLANPGPDELEIIEVQLGDELREDDIVRLEDDFGR